MRAISAPSYVLKEHLSRQSGSRNQGFREPLSLKDRRLLHAHLTMAVINRTVCPPCVGRLPLQECQSRLMTRRSTRGNVRSSATLLSCSECRFHWLADFILSTGSQTLPKRARERRAHRRLELAVWRSPCSENARETAAKYCPHKFRATYCTKLLQSGIDLKTVQKLMGHKTIKSTMRYLAKACLSSPSGERQGLWTRACNKC